ncbi:MAG: FAD-dependent oxidoreductase [candidate division NC10 bacterium]|nr:FAD-dependent oxidoreductase [candidate division NC10 bacterium]
MEVQDVSRRDLLIGSLTLAGGQLAGWGRTSAAAADGAAGRIVGTSCREGHLLLGGFAFPRATRTERASVVIVGGGVAGLAAARRLRRAGFRDFLVVELEETVGGNARAGRTEVTAFPWGSHYLPLPGPETREVKRLLFELGVIERFDRRGRPTYDERHLAHAPQERLFIHGRWQSGIYPWTGATARDLAEYAAFREAMTRFRDWRDAAGRRAFTIPRAAGAPGAFRELDRISMAEYLRSNGWTSRRLHWYVEYGMRDDYGVGAAEVSAWAGIHYYAARLHDPEYEDVVLTWPEGNGWLVDRMAEPARDQIRVGQLVYNVAQAGNRVAVEVFDLQSRVSYRLLAREAILACPLFVAARLYRPWREKPPAFLSSFHYAPWLVANLHLPAPPDDGPGVPLAWDNIIYESEALGYVVATHQSLRISRGPTVWTYYQSFPHRAPQAVRREFLGGSWETFRDRILADLSRAHPEIGRRARRLDVMLYGHAMVRPEIGFVCGRAREQAISASRGPVHLAHADLSGLSLFEEAFEWGTRAAAQALARLGR